MARSWRSFFKKSEEEPERDSGSSVATKPEGDALVDEVSQNEVEATLLQTPVEERQESGGWFGRLRQGLSRSRESVVGQLNAAVAAFRDVGDEEFWERVEEILIASDVGVAGARIRHRRDPYHRQAGAPPDMKAHARGERHFQSSWHREPPDTEKVN